MEQVRTRRYGLVALLLALGSVSACQVANPPERDTLTELATDVHDIVRQDQRYGPDREQVLDVIGPSTRSSNGRGLVWLHNGGWVYGDENALPPVLDSLVEQDGYTVFAVRYRLSGMAPWPAQPEDVDRAMRWLKTHADRYRVDPDRLVAFGWSSGAHLALLSGLAGGAFGADDLTAEEREVSPTPAGVVALAPPIDLRAFAASSSDARDLVEALFDCTLARCDANLFRAADPVTYADAGDPLVYIAQGDRDDVVPVAATDAAIPKLEGRIGEPRVWYDRVDTGPVEFRGHAVDQALNLTVLRVFLDAVNVDAGDRR